MADYGFNYNLGPQTKPTSIADMLNLANSAQQFQQAQQLNPLLLRQQQLATQKAEALTPEEITTGTVKAQEERKREPIATSKQQLELDKQIGSLAVQIIGGVGTDPRIQNAARDPKGAIDALTQTAHVMIASGIPPESAQKFLAPIVAVVQSEPDKLPIIMKNLSSMGTTSESQIGRMTPQLTAGAGGAPATFVSGTNTLTQPTIKQQPKDQGEPAMVLPGEAAAPAPAAGQPYPKRVAGDIRPYAPGEKQDEESGIAYKNTLVKRQGELTTAKRNLDEVIKEATKLDPNSVWSSGFLGMVNRKFKDFIGDPSYKQLSKDLANVQIANIQAMGGSLDTVAGQQLTKMANGDETYPPSVLINIARRAYADLTDLDMRATAAEKYAQKFGVANMNTFKQQWAANSDSKLFEAIAIEKSNLPPEQKKKEFKALIGTDPSVLRDLQQKKKNLEKLMTTGEL